MFKILVTKTSNNPEKVELNTEIGFVKRTEGCSVKLKGS